MSSEPFHLPPTIIEGLTWHDARKRYIEPQLERQKKYEPKDETPKGGDPQAEMEQAMAAAIAFNKGETSLQEIQESFLKSWGKPFPEDMVERLNARMQKKEQAAKNPPFRNKPGEPIRTELDPGEVLPEERP